VVGDDDVLVQVRAAGVEIGIWHVMTGMPYLLRVMGFGLRKPKVPVRGRDVAGIVEAVGKNVTGSGRETRCSAPPTVPSRSTRPRRRTSWR